MHDPAPRRDAFIEKWRLTSPTRRYGDVSRPQAEGLYVSSREWNPPLAGDTPGFAARKMPDPEGGACAAVAQDSQTHQGVKGEM